jgi:hypothetical protein
MMNSLDTPIGSPALTRWTQVRMWIWRVLDASVIDVGDEHYVGSI